MKKLRYKRISPVLHSDYYEIEFTWFRVDPGFRETPELQTRINWSRHSLLKLSLVPDFYNWFADNCDGWWYQSLDSTQTLLYFSNEEDRCKFILKFM